MIGLVDYDSESGSEQSADEELRAPKPQKKSISKSDEIDFFAKEDDANQDDGNSADAVPLFDEEENDLEDVVKPKVWEKALAEKAKRKLEKKAEKNKKKQAKLNAKNAEAEVAASTKDLGLKPKKRAQIALFGALNMTSDVASDSDEDEDKPGPSSLAQPGAKGLLGMLPAPSKMAATKPGSSKQGIMLPASLRASAAKKPGSTPITTTTIVKKPIVSNDQDSDSDDEPADFFGLTSTEPSEKIPRFENDQLEVPIIPSGGLDAVVGPMRPSTNEYVHPSEMYNMAGVDLEQKHTGVITDAEAHRLILEREGDFSGMGVSDIVNSIQDVSVEQALGPNVHAQLLRNLTKQQHAKSTHVPIPKAGGVRDVNAKRKHQITYLAQMAVAREEALQEARADSKHTKRMARQKYGF